VLPYQSSSCNCTPAGIANPGRLPSGAIHFVGSRQSGSQFAEELHQSGSYFLGLPWFYKEKSALLFGIGEDAAFVASAIEARS
jgi:hypothetical protein